jgi:hypothetical protein
MDRRWSFSDKLAVALACLAGVMALMLFWMDKTPMAAGITIAVMALLMVYPVLHFVSPWKARIPVFAIVFILIGAFGWKFWPKNSTLQSVSVPQTYPKSPPSTANAESPRLKPTSKPVRETPALQTKDANPSQVVTQTGAANTNTGSITAQPGSVVSVGQSGGITAGTINIAPPTPKIMGFGIVQPSDPEYKVFPAIADKRLVTQVKFYGDVAWNDPKFAIYCDRPCTPIYVEPLHPDQIIIPGFTGYRVKSIPNGAVFAIRHTPFLSNEYFQVAVQSEDNNPVQVLKIEPFLGELTQQ